MKSSTKYLICCLVLAILIVLLIIAGQVVATVYVVQIAVKPALWMISIWGFGSCFILLPALMGTIALSVMVYEELQKQDRLCGNQH